MEIGLKFYESESDRPPSLLRSNMEESCEVRGVICRGVEELEDYISRNNRRFKMASYEVAMVPSGAAVEFSLLYRGRRVGSHTLSIKSG